MRATRKTTATESPHTWPICVPTATVPGTSAISARTCARRFAIRAVLGVAALLIAYALAEVAYRVHQYRAVREAIVESRLALVHANSTGPRRFDQYTGHRYLPNVEVGPIAAPYPIHWRTNSHGHIAREDYLQLRPADEFRIGLVGGSSTANVANATRWADVAEDELNRSAEWRRFVAGRRTRVVNFALDGIGGEQFADVVEKMVAPFEVNLLIVELTRFDLARRRAFHWGGPGVVRDEIVTWAEISVLPTMPWWRLHPELLRVALGGRGTLLRAPRFSVVEAESMFGTSPYYTNPSDAARVAEAAARRIVARFPEAVWLVHPEYWVYTNQEWPVFRIAFEEFARRLPELRIVAMMDRLQRGDLDSRFHVPHDQTDSDYGLSMYGEAVARFLEDEARAGRLRAR
jgi:hypothetical protein